MAVRPTNLPAHLWKLLLLTAVACQQSPPSEESKTAALEAAPTTATPDTLHLLAPGRAGQARIGMRVGALKALFGPALREVTLRRGAEDFPAFAIGRVSKTPVPALLLEPLCEEGEDNRDGSPSDECRIWRITIRDPAYHTANGLGVGSTFGQLKAAAPISYVGQTPMGIAATAEDWHLDFLLDPNAIASRGLPSHFETIHDSVKVVGVQLYRP